MSIVLAVTAVSPDEIAIIGDWVTAQGVQRCIEQMNWSAANRPSVHVNESFGHFDTGTLGEDFGDGVPEFEVGDTVKLRTRIYVSADYSTVRVGAEAFIEDASNTGVLTIDLDGDTDTITFTDADNDTEKTVDFTGVAAGWRELTASLELTASSGSNDRVLKAFRIQEVAVSSGFAEPQDP